MPKLKGKYNIKIRPLTEDEGKGWLAEAIGVNGGYTDGETPIDAFNNLQELMVFLEKIELIAQEEKQQRSTDIKGLSAHLLKLKALAVLDAIQHGSLLQHIKHDRTSCNDDNPCNGYIESKGYARCNKCHLIEVLRDHDLGVHNFSVNINVALEKII